MNGSHILTQAKNRQMRTNQRPFLKHQKVIKGSAEKILSPLSKCIVSESNLEFALDILYEANEVSKSYGTKVARYIAENIIPGVKSPKDAFFMVEHSTLPEDQRDIIKESIDNYSASIRISNNQERIDRRFDFSKYIRERSRFEDQSDTILELCSLIDTFNMSPGVKMIVSLENILYSYYTNGISVDPSTVAETVTEYFLTRESSISDKDYSDYNWVLNNTNLYDQSKMKPLSRAVMENAGGYYSNKFFSIAEDDMVPASIKEKINGFHENVTEEKCIDYMSAIGECIKTEYPSTDTRALLYESVDLLPLAFGIDEGFINIERDVHLDDEDRKECTVKDDIIPEEEPIIEKDWGSDIYDKEALENAFKESTEYADSKDITDLLVKFKAEQDKSPSKFKNFIYKLHARKPEDIIDGMPNIFGAVRAIFIIGVTTVTPLGPIFGAIAALVDWFLSKKINDDQTEKLLRYLRNEKSTLKKKAEKTSNDKKKQEIEDYIKCLDKCISEVEDYADTISDEDHSDMDSGDDDDDFDFDMDFESCTFATGVILESANRIIDFHKKGMPGKNLHETFNILAEHHLFTDFVEVANYSSIDIGLFAEAVDQSKKIVKDNPKLVTEITSGVERAKSFNNEKLSTPNRILAEAIADETVTKVVSEKFNLNTIKLAIQDGKAKLKDLNTKQKSFWQTVDAQASGMTKSMEKALTSDRREAIIKGNIIPSFSKCIKGGIALAGLGIVCGPAVAAIGAVGAFAASKALNYKEKKLIYDEIDTELKVVERQIEIAQNEGDMNQYRFLLNYQKKLTREYQRIKYGMKAQGRDIPRSARPE